MKLIDASPYPHSIYVLRSTLEREGIGCILNNDNLSQLSGEVPVTSCYVEIYVEDEFETKALEILNKIRSISKNEKSFWVCDNCQETIGSQFDMCWKCETFKKECSS